MIYYSKKDVWLVLVIALSVVMCFAVGILMLLADDGDSRMAGWIVIGTGVAVGALILWLTYPLYYEITALEVRVRSGVIRWHIPIEAIEEVSPTNSALSSPAMSLDRLSIIYSVKGASRALLISPDNKAGFIRELASSAPHLQMSGDGLKRKTR